MSITKRSISFMLSVIMLATVLLVAPVTASAEDDYTVIPGGSSMSSATAVSFNKMYAARLTYEEVLYFKFTVPKGRGFVELYGKNISINTKYTSDNYSLNLSVYDRYEHFQGYLTLKENEEDYYNSKGLSEDTTYYLIVHNGSPHRSPGYFKFKLSFFADEAYDKVEDASAYGSVISTNTKITGTIDGTTDYEYYKFKTGSAKKYQLQVQTGNWITYGSYASNSFEIRNGIDEKLIGVYVYDYKCDTVQVTDAIELQPNTYYYVYVEPYKIRHATYSFTVVDPTQPMSVKLNKTSLSLLVNQTATLTAAVSPSTAPKTVTWASSNKAVAAVSAKGYVVAKGPGTAMITAKTTNGKIAKCTVKVLPATPKITKFENVNTGVKMTWGKIPGAASYILYIKTGSTWKALGSVKSNAYIYTKAKSGAKYTFTVRAADKSGKILSGYYKNGWSTIFYAAPTLKSAKYYSQKKGIVFTWYPVKGVTKYRVYRKINGGAWKAIYNTTNAKYVSFVDKNVKKGNTYTYTVRCLSANGKKIVSGLNAKGLTYKYK